MLDSQSTGMFVGLISFVIFKDANALSLEYLPKLGIDYSQSLLFIIEREDTHESSI